MISDNNRTHMKMKSVFTITVIGAVADRSICTTIAATATTATTATTAATTGASGASPGNADHHEKRPKVPVTYLGVDTSQVPTVVSDQLGLAKGFGLVVDYVEPNSPAATAGVQQNDILKMLNDQILLEPSQLRKLLQTFPTERK
jgi:S1-C subfamily serine protease